MENKILYKERMIKISLIIVCQLLFMALTMPIFVFYGPFENLKRTVVGAAMTTLTHQYIAKTFLSDQAISRIMSYSVIEEPSVEDGITGIVKNVFNQKNFSNQIEILNIDGGSFVGKLMIVHDPTRVKLGYSSAMPKSGETTSSIARREKAIAAINAGGFLDQGWVGTGGAPLGFVIHEGKVVYDEKDGKDVRQDAIVITDSGVMVVGRYTVAKLLEIGAKEGVTFGPPLIVNGQPMIKRGDGGWGIAPRTAIAQRKDGAIMFLVVDGRSIKSFGATLKDVQEIFLMNNAITAVNLDGGSSATMFANGKIVNSPSDALGERAVPTVFLVKD